MEGQIYKIHSDFYYVQNGEQTFECKIREVLKKQTKESLDKLADLPQAIPLDKPDEW